MFFKTPNTGKLSHNQLGNHTVLLLMVVYTHNYSYFQDIDNWLGDYIPIGSAYNMTIDRGRTSFMFSYFQVISWIMSQGVWLCFLLHVTECLLHFLCCWWHSIASLTDGQDCARKDLLVLDTVALAQLSLREFRFNA